MAGKKMIILQSSDGETFDVEEAVAEMSQTIKNLMEECSSGDMIPLPNVTGSFLAKVIEYCKMHHDKSGRDLKAWDDEFLPANIAFRFELLMAANYLDIASLLDLCCQSIADFIKDKSPEEIRLKLNIKNDFTPQEEQKIREECKWAFDSIEQ